MKSSQVKRQRGSLENLFEPVTIDIPLKNFHQNNGAKILPFAGFNMPINYKTGIINEHKNVEIILVFLMLVIWGKF